MADKVHGLAIKLRFLSSPCTRSPRKMCPGQPWVLLPLCAKAALTPAVSIVIMAFFVMNTLGLEAPSLPEADLAEPQTVCNLSGSRR